MIEIRPLRPDDRRDTFFSGDIELDRFFQKFAGQNQFQLHIGTTYIAVRENEIVGFVTLSATSIMIDGLPEAARKTTSQISSARVETSATCSCQINTWPRYRQATFTSDLRNRA